MNDFYLDQLDAKIHTATPEGAADTGRNESSAFVVTPYGSFLWAAAAVVAKLMPLRQLRQIAKEKGPEGPFCLSASVDLIERRQLFGAQKGGSVAERPQRSYQH